MRTDLFQHELSKTSAIFGRSEDVQVAFDQGGARTDGKTVFLPVLAGGREVSPEAMEVMRGYVDHEAGHLRHSDMPKILSAYKAWGEKGEAWIAKLHNGIEDVWLERRVMAEYPGAERHLRAVSTEVNSRTLEAIAKGEIGDEMLANPAAVVGVAVTWEGRKTYGGPTNEALLERLHPAIREKLAGYVERTLACKNSAETLKLAQQIADELREEFEKDEEKESKAEGKPEEDEGEGEGDESKGSEGEDEAKTEESEDGEGEDGEGEESEGSEDSEGSEGEESEVEGEDVGGEATGAVASGDGEPKGKPKGEPKMDTEAEAMDPDLGKKVEAMLDREGIDGRKDGAYAPVTTAQDRFWHVKRLDEAAKGVTKKRRVEKIRDVLTSGSPAAYDRIVRGMTGEVSVMRRGLERALLARQTRDWVGGKEAGRLDTRRFVAAAAGRPNVFKEREDRAEMDTAVTLLVDLSGSMANGGRDRLAMESTIGMVEALVKTGVALEVLGFNQCTRGDGSKAGRNEPLDMWVFKAFEDRLFEAKGPLSTISAACHASGNNCDGESLMLAYDRLKRRGERRKVLFVLSDGLPECFPYVHGHAGGQKALADHLMACVKHVEGQGVEVVAVGIQSRAVTQFYQKHIVVTNLAELAQKTLSLLGKLLLGEGRRGG